MSTHVHVWTYPHDWVGGLRENPGVFGLSGARLAVIAACEDCGAQRRQVTGPGPHARTHTTITPDVYRVHLLTAICEAVIEDGADVVAVDGEVLVVPSADLTGDVLAAVDYRHPAAWRDAAPNAWRLRCVGGRLHRTRVVTRMTSVGGGR